MIWIDYAILGLTGISGLMGMVRGFIKELLSLCLWGSAAWLAMTYGQALSVHLNAMFSVPMVRLAASSAIIFIATVVVGGMVTYLLGRLVDSAGLSGTDRMLGSLFGILRGVAIAAVLVFFGDMTPLSHDPSWHHSRLIPPIQSLTVWAKSQIPANLTGRLKLH